MNPSSFSVVSILIISLLLLSQPFSSDATVKCDVISERMKPCIDWMTTGYKRTGVAPKTCCNELFRINSMGINSEAEKAICECVKSEMQGLDINDIVAISLSGRCQISLPFPITPNVNCSEI